MLRLLDPSIGPILTHGAVEATNAVLRAQGLTLPATTQVTPDLDLKTLRGAMVLAPPLRPRLGPGRGAFGPVSTGFASGWMRLRGVRRRAGPPTAASPSPTMPTGTGSTVPSPPPAPPAPSSVTHGYTTQFSRWLAEQGYEAGIVETEFGGETLDDPTPEEARP